VPETIGYLHADYPGGRYLPSTFANINTRSAVEGSAVDVLGTISTRATPQSVQADPRQTLNAAGGWTFKIDDEARLRRFLVIGAEGGTYYASARETAFDNVDVLKRFAANDPIRLVDVIVDISVRGAAPKQGPVLFALAYAAAHGDRGYALAQLPKVARTGSALLTFAGYVEQFRGWGRGLRRAVGNWYLEKDADALAYQVVKYRSRNNWSQRDLLRLSHPIATNPALNATLKWVVNGSTDADTPRLIEGFLKTQEPGANFAVLVGEYGLSWEMLPDEALSVPRVWEELVGRGMPMTALMRQLPRLTRLGILPPMGGLTEDIVGQLTDGDRLRKARVHPMNVLVAQRTYTSGQSLRGSSEWTPNSRIVDALDSAFYSAYGNVEPAGKRTLIALDISGSMGYENIGGLPLTPRDASAAIALVTMATEPSVAVVGFSDTLIPLNISPRQRLDDVIRTVSNLPFGGTDCSLPMLYASREKLEVDTFIVLTDSETWAGRHGHPHQTLQDYRDRWGIDAKMIVVGMTATECSIADPADPGMLDIAGLDTAVPQLIANFSRGF